ncbi:MULTISPECIES: hypothetical protein [unclassified Mesorhizobium]|nr:MULTISPECIES: hypothetical protein [unclassified Mesorhizobium]
MTLKTFLLALGTISLLSGIGVTAAQAADTLRVCSQTADQDSFQPVPWW